MSVDVVTSDDVVMFIEAKRVKDMEPLRFLVENGHDARERVPVPFTEATILQVLRFLNCRDHGFFDVTLLRNVSFDNLHALLKASLYFGIATLRRHAAVWMMARVRRGLSSEELTTLSTSDSTVIRCLFLSLANDTATRPSKAALDLEQEIKKLDIISSNVFRVPANSPLGKVLPIERMDGWSVFRYLPSQGVYHVSKDVVTWAAVQCSRRAAAEAEPDNVADALC